MIYLLVLVYLLILELYRDHHTDKLYIPISSLTQNFLESNNLEPIPTLDNPKPDTILPVTYIRRKYDLNSEVNPGYEGSVSDFITTDTLPFLEPAPPPPFLTTD